MSPASIHYPKAWAIGLLRLASGDLPLPISERDARQDTAWAGSALDGLALKPGLPVHLIGDGADALGVWPLESALIQRGLPFSCAEGAGWDAPRTEMFVRRFQPQAILGLSLGVLDALVAAGHEPRQLFGYGPTLMATPQAAERLALHALPCWRLAMLGPALAIESPQRDGLRYNSSEWLVEEDHSELLLTSLAARAWPMVRFRLGIKGKVETVLTGKGPERRLRLA